MGDSAEVTTTEQAEGTGQEKLNEVAQLREWFKMETAAVSEVIRLRGLIQASLFRLSDLHQQNIDI